MNGLTETTSGQEAAFWWMGSLSLVMFLGALVVIPLIVVRIPADYFSGKRRQPAAWSRQHPVIRFVLRGAKTLLGLVFVRVH